VTDTTQDQFLNGKLLINQPKFGYRAATDPVFLAAFTPAEPGQSVLELGCGVGVASLCLGWRVGGLDITGLELQADYAALARENAAQNAQELSVVEGDVEAMPQALRTQEFDHVITNPPFFEAASHSPSPVPGKDIANRSAEPVGWIANGLRRLKPGGWITLVQRSEHLGDILGGLDGKTGDCMILPIAARAGRAADRVLVRARKGAKGKLTLLAPFVVHKGAQHQDGADGYSEQAQAVLRHGNALQL